MQLCAEKVRSLTCKEENDRLEWIEKESEWFAEDPPQNCDKTVENNISGTSYRLINNKHVRNDEKCNLLTESKLERAK